ncbi:MAG: efflux RND transporter periplasmic adaptor subunit, partial [Firmicutes bacterium]|nr:efflux RND transporter periplasmic adaptor subunit [Bacillota bacterium]
QSLRETRAAISQLEMEIEMAKFQVDQAKVGRDQLLRETRKQAELALLQAEEGEAAARTQVQMLKKMAKQQESLALGQKKQAEASLEAAKAGLELAQKGAREEDLQAAGAGVKQARAAVALARSQLDKGILKAPIAGQATAVQAQVGELAGPGSPLLAIVNSQLLKVEFNLTERLINSVLPGDEVKIRFLTLPEREFTGIITTVSPAPDPRTGVFPAEAVLENAEGTLKPGLFADVELVVADSTGNLVIPQGALLEEGTEDYVYIVQGGRARRKPVSLGLSNGEKVEVLSGLSETDFLVVKGQHYLEDGGRVSIQEWSGGEGR